MDFTPVCVHCGRPVKRRGPEVYPCYACTVLKKDIRIAVRNYLARLRKAK